MALQIRKQECPCEHSHFFPSLSEAFFRSFKPYRWKTRKVPQLFLVLFFFFFHSSLAFSYRDKEGLRVMKLFGLCQREETDKNNKRH